MAADRHQPAFVPTDETFREAEIQNHLDGVTAKRVLRDAHAPNQHGGPGGVNQPGELLHRRAVHAGLGFQFGECQMGNPGPEFVKTAGVIADEVFVHPAVRDENF